MSLKKVKVLLREDQIAKLNELTRKVYVNVGGAPDGSEVLRGILDAYFKMCESGARPASPLEPLSQEGTGGDSRPLLVRLVRSVKMGDTTWPAGVKVEVLEEYDQRMVKVAGRKPIDIVVPMVIVRFPDAATGRVSKQVLDLG